MLTEKELSEIEARRSSADIPDLVAELRRCRAVVDAALNLNEADDRMNELNKTYKRLRDEQVEKEEAFRAALRQITEEATEEADE